jgi:hypothetical protein
LRSGRDEAGFFSCRLQRTGTVEWLEGDEERPHHRAEEMTSALPDLAALGHVAYNDLLRFGFTSAEIIEHHPAAEKLARRDL